jgi:hypothetical protein
MPPESNLEYALTRIQSQYGRRLTVSDWHRLESAHDLGQYLDGMRRGALAPLVSSLDRNREAHAIERFLRSAWARYVREVSAWHPRRWQSWLAWLEWLPRLGLMAQLARAEAAPAWLQADPLLRPVTGATRVERLAALTGAGLEVFEPGIAGRVPLDELWLARWRAFKPSADARTDELLKVTCEAVQNHARQLESDGVDVTALREQLRERLEKLFRATSGTVVATLCHLALMALDLERLRGGLVTRSLFARGQ